MPKFIVKPMPDEDFYVEWSTVVDAPTGFGSRQDLAELLGPQDGAPERFERADEFGTSMRDPQLEPDRRWFSWHEDEFRLCEWPIPDVRHDKGTYHVPRQNVRALCERWEQDADPTDLIVFRPHED